MNKVRGIYESITGALAAVLGRLWRGKRYDGCDTPVLADLHREFPDGYWTIEPDDPNDADIAAVTESVLNYLYAKHKSIDPTE